uniref:Protein kinase domain-containing protein n=1 Tax=Monodelphis domestica TaxID=13616 RepID=A0A5F8GMG0_MONDO
MSVGVLAYVMLTGISPFLGDDKQETFLNISQMNVSYSEEELDAVSEAAVDFIKALLVKRPEDRATAEECLRHPWLTQGGGPEPPFRVKGLMKEPGGLQEEEDAPGPEAPAEAEKPQPEELIVVASYTLGPCPCPKAISKRFRFEEPLLPEMPGEFVY